MRPVKTAAALFFASCVASATLLGVGFAQASDGPSTSTTHCCGKPTTDGKDWTAPNPKQLEQFDFNK